MTQHLSASEYRKQMDGPKRKSKYGNEKVTIGNETFDSKREAKRWQYLMARLKAGEISHLERQPVFKLAIGDRPIVIRSKRYPNGRQVKYIADFAYFDGENRVVEDAKGHRTRDFIIKKAVVEAMFPAVRVAEV